MDIETISLTVLLILNFIALTSIFVRMENRFTKLEVLMEMHGVVVLLLEVPLAILIILIPMLHLLLQLKVLVD